MPYIDNTPETEYRRVALDIEGAAGAKTAGELNYALTKSVLAYQRRHGLSYQTINDISGALTECLAEYRRRVTVPYENSKIAINGDVYSD